MAVLSRDGGVPAPRPRVLVSGARALFVGPGLGLSPHRNAVATVAVALDRPFELDLLDEAGRDGGPGEGGAGPAGPTRMAARMAVIPPNRLHHLRPRGDMAFLYLDALGDDLRGLRRDAEPDERLIAHLRLLRGQETVTAADLGHALRLVGIVPRPAGSGPVAEVVRLMDRRPQDFGPVAEAARLAGLSASRFQCLFRAETGVPYRRYRSWRRMAAVARSLSAGATLTEAALDAGFAGSSHLSAAFRAMFGIKPSLLLTLGTEISSLDDRCPRSDPPAEAGGDGPPGGLRTRP